MSTYRVEWPCCGSATETQAWEPERCPFCEPDNTALDPALLALAKLGAWLCAHHWLDIDGGADGFGPAKSGLIMNAAMRYGVMHPDNSPCFGIAWTVESLLAPDGAASEGVTDGD